MSTSVHCSLRRCRSASPRSSCWRCWADCSTRPGSETPRRQTVNAIETGRYDPSLPLAFKIAGVFDDRIEALFFPTDNTDTTNASS